MGIPVAVCFRVGWCRTKVQAGSGSEITMRRKSPESQVAVHIGFFFVFSILREMDGVHWQMYFVSGFATKGSGSELHHTQVQASARSLYLWPSFLHSVDMHGVQCFNFKCFKIMMIANSSASGLALPTGTLWFCLSAFP